MLPFFAKVIGAHAAVLWAASVSLLLLGGPAWPHATQLSSSRVEVHGNDVAVLLELNGRDVEVALETTLLTANGAVDAEASRRAEAVLTDYILSRARLSNSAGAACRGRITEVRPKAEHLLVRVEWACAPVTGRLVYEVTLFQEIDPAARHMLTASGDVSRMALLSVSAPRIELTDTRAQLGQVLWHYFLAGVEHIATGYDHIAFLLAIVLWGRRFWPLVGVVTAFTLAHSITLSLAVLDVVRLPSRVAETLVALSIVYVAAENFFVHDLHRRWRIAFLFGLIHGFGFASVLRDYGIPGDALMPALAAFNAGVEAGQIAIVVLALGLLAVLQQLLRAHAPDIAPRALPYAVSAAILLLGLYWTAERLLFPT